MNFAVIFAGGVGNRMKNGTLPKQFLEIDNKPIIIYTLEKFEETKDIQKIIVVCVEGWEKYLQELVDRFNITKVTNIITGGSSALLSQKKGIDFVYDNFRTNKNDVVLIHDGVRPLIDQNTIEENIKTAKEKGSAITVVPAIETIGISDSNGQVNRFVDRSKCIMARAPQTYNLDLIKKIFDEEDVQNELFVDSATMVQNKGYSLNVVYGNTDNIKVTTPTDFYIFKAILEAQKNIKIFGE